MLSHFQTNNIHPKLVASSVIAKAVNAQRELGLLCDLAEAELAKPNAEIRAGHVTEAGAAIVRRAIAARYLEDLRRIIKPLVGHAIGAAEGLRAEFNASILVAESKLGSLAVARAVAIAERMQDGDCSDAERERFTADLRAGVTEAVHAAVAMSSYGPLASLAELGKQKLGDSLLSPEKVGDVRRVELAAAIVGDQYQAVETALVTMSRTGAYDAGDDPRRLIERANDASANKREDEAALLGIVAPRSASSGRPSSNKPVPSPTALLDRANATGSRQGAA